MLTISEEKLKQSIPAYLWYRLFYIKKEYPKFDKVQFPIVKKPLG